MVNSAFGIEISGNGNTIANIANAGTSVNQVANITDNQFEMIKEAFDAIHDSLDALKLSHQTQMKVVALLEEVKQPELRKNPSKLKELGSEVVKLVTSPTASALGTVLAQNATQALALLPAFSA